MHEQSEILTEPPARAGEGHENGGVAESFAWCERLARSHYENFPVGSLLVPRAVRRHVYSIYAFARVADDLADEGYESDDGPSEAQRLAELDAWETKLDAAVRGRADHPVFIALAVTLRELRLPADLLRDLLSAFKQDVTRRRYENFEEVLDYCARSANPVGRLILHLFGYADEERQRLSDEICTALQLANFWQDVAVDIRKDRVYLPRDEMARFGVCVEDLRARRFGPEYAALMRFQVERTREGFLRGAALPSRVRGRLAIELRLTWLGGMRILERIEEMNYDTLNARPRITSADKIRILFKSLVGLP
ncbi:MAG: squalene synthase HpnC [Blastocatellia bacterium]|nr:squalene synthase HpnC [Blastocatellia bacterium]